MHINLPLLARNILFVIFILTIFFHLLVIIGIIPYTMVWGGRLTSAKEMYRFETVSLLLNLIFLWIVMMKTTVTKRIIPIKIINGILWGMSLLFFVNTIGNLVSINHLERLIFTPITVLLSFSSGILAKTDFRTPGR